MTSEEIVADFRKRYEGTFVFVKEPCSDEENLFYVERIEASETKLGVLHLVSNEVGKIRLNFGSAHTLKFVPAPVGVFQSGKKALLCRRRPQRQWRRGICADNTQIREVTHRCITDRGTAVSLDTLTDAFANKSVSFQQALKLLESGKYQSVAIKGNYSLCLSFTAVKEHILFFWDTPIAKIDSAGKVVLVLEAVYAPQIQSITES